MTKYIPQRQDLIWLDFDPSSGKEINKRRPALVISSIGYNKLTKLVFVCPITHIKNSNSKKTGLLISISDIAEVDGYINPLQLHTYDYQVRNAEKIAELDDDTFYSVLKIIRDIVE